MIVNAILGAAGVIWSELVRMLWQRRGIDSPAEDGAVAGAKSGAFPRQETFLVAGLAVIAGLIGAYVVDTPFQAILAGFGVPTGPRGVLRMLGLLKPPADTPRTAPEFPSSEDLPHDVHAPVVALKPRSVLRRFAD